MVELSQDSYSTSGDFGSDVNDDNIMPLDVDDPRHIFRNATWNQTDFSYDPAQIQFQGNGGTRGFYDVMPTLLQFWELFWPATIMRTIVRESNKYAETIMNAFGHTMGGPDWISLTIPGLRAFMALHIYMGLKKQPNVKSYW